MAFIESAKPFQTRLVCAACSFGNIAYILRKAPLNVVTSHLENFLRTCEVIDLTTDDLKAGINLGFADLEDAFQMIAATKAGANFVVTNDMVFTSESSARLPILTPQQACTFLMGLSGTPMA